MSIHRNSFPKKSSRTNKHTTDIDGKIYDVYKLVHQAESLPVEIVPVASLLGFLKGNKCWKDSQGEMFGPEDIEKIVGDSLDWGQMKADYPKFAEHIMQIKNADLTVKSAI